MRVMASSLIPKQIVKIPEETCKQHLRNYKKEFIAMISKGFAIDYWQGIIF